LLIQVTPEEYTQIQSQVKPPEETKPGLISDSGFPTLRRVYDRQEGLRASAIFYRINDLRGIQAQHCDNLITLAYYGDIPIKSFVAYNDLTSNDVIRPGEIYYLESKAKRAKIPYHIVQKGQTLHKISNIYGVRLKSLQKFNYVLATQRLQPGRVPRPGGSGGGVPGERAVRVGLLRRRGLLPERVRGPVRGVRRRQRARLLRAGDRGAARRPRRLRGGAVAGRAVPGAELRRRGAHELRGLRRARGGVPLGELRRRHRAAGRALQRPRRVQRARPGALRALRLPAGRVRRHVRERRRLHVQVPLRPGEPRLRAADRRHLPRGRSHARRRRRQARELRPLRVRGLGLQEGLLVGEGLRAAERLRPGHPRLRPGRPQPRRQRVRGPVRGVRRRQRARLLRAGDRGAA
ncbi:MAG: LysM peptidoglycan-binding domain-containing protein, partial [Proteobacteria bacterium]